MVDSKVASEHNIHAYDEDAKWQLPEPTALMSAKAYREKNAMPLVARLKEIVKSLTIKCVNYVEHIFIAVHDCLGTHHLHPGKSRPLFAAQQTKWQVRHACHGSQYEIIFQSNAADHQRSSQITHVLYQSFM